MIDPSREAELRDAIEAMFFGYRAFTDQPDRILEERSLGRVHHRILYFVGRRPGGSVKGLLEVLAVTKQALNVPLRRLVDLKLISMTADPTDGRVRNLRLTPSGEALELELTSAQMRGLSEAFDAAGPDSKAGWKRVMDSLGGHTDANAAVRRADIPNFRDG